MANDTQTVTTLLKYQVDTGTISTALNANAKIAASYEDVAAAAAQVGLTAEEFAARTGIQLTAANLIAAAEVKVADAYKQVAVSADQAAKAQAASNSISPQQIAGRVAGLGSIVGSAGGAGFRDAAQIIQLTTAFGAAGAIAGIAAIGVRAFTSEVERETKVQEARLDAERQAAHDLTTLTTAQTEEKIRAAQASLTIDQQVNKKLTDSFNDYADSLTLPQRTAAELGQTDATYNAYKDAIAKGNVAIEGSEAYVDAYSQAIEKNGTAAADAAAYLATHSDLLLKESDARLAGDKLTEDERKKKIFAIGQEIEVDQQLLDTKQLDSDTSNELIDKIRGLRAEQRGYADVVTSSADALEKLTKAQEAYKDNVDQLFDAQASEGKARDAITADLAKIADLRTDANAKEADALANKNDAILNAETAAGERRTEIAQKTADAIAKIERDAGRAEGESIGNRDANAFRQAQIKEADALEDQKKADAKQITQLGASLAKQETTINTSYDKQIRSVETSLAAQTRIQEQKLLQDQVDLINITNAELAISQNAGIGIVSAHESIMQGIETTILNYGNRIRNGLESALGGVAGSFSPLPAVTGTAAIHNIAVNAARQTVYGYVRDARRAY